ncbi:MAG: hypothetical protein IPL61_13450 [Myxococcales bacterium]|nr:hypothetical protein [Myxococcales bacterium]
MRPAPATRGRARVARARLALVAAIAAGAGAVTATPAAAECRRRGVGTPIYRAQTEPAQPVPPGETTSVQTQTLAIYAEGTWTWVGAGEAGSGEAMGRSGCVSRAAMRELTRAVTRARFKHGLGATCDALPVVRTTHEAPRRRRQIVVESPCGEPLDASTAALVACARAVTEPSPPLGAALRAECRPR